MHIHMPAGFLDTNIFFLLIRLGIRIFCCIKRPLPGGIIHVGFTVIGNRNLFLTL